MTDVNIFEDLGGVDTELRDGKNVMHSRDLRPYLEKLNQIEVITQERLAQGKGYEHRTSVLTERADRAESSFRAAGELMDNEYTISIRQEPLPAAEGEQAKTMLRIALVGKREDTPVSSAKKQFGVQRRNLANRATELQAAPDNNDIKAAVREQIAATVKAAQDADKLVKEDAKLTHENEKGQTVPNQSPMQLEKHQGFMQATKVMVDQLQAVVGTTKDPK